MALKVQFGPLRVQNSNSEAFIDHSTIFDPKISQHWNSLLFQ